jgi:hypothetical protein
LPEQIGTARTWVKAVYAGDRAIGLQADGTLWEWGHSADPVEIEPGSKWADVTALGSYKLAVRQDRTLWEWGSGMPWAGMGAFQVSSAFSQIGTNSGWASVSSAWSSTLAVRTDGTLWARGQVRAWGGSSAGLNGTVTLPFQTQVCQETNWVGLLEGFPTMALTRNGDLWELSGARPNPQAPAAAVCRLIASNAAPGRIATTYCGDRKIYELRGDGTLWEKPCLFGLATEAKKFSWRRVGRRSDWVYITAAGATAFGLTADGTVWTWGHDPTRASPAGLLANLRLMQMRISSAIAGRGPMAFGTATVPGIQKQPRPLMRLIAAPNP